MPTSEALLIIVNGNVVTNQIQPPSIRIIRERGKRVSTASFIIENGVSLNLAQWNSVVIYSSDLATVYFNGFLMSRKATKNGIQMDYTIECSSVEILLQKAIINGSFTGTDDEILTAILANAYPDLSDFFDWSSGITPVLLSDITMDFQDMNLMDALDMLSAQAGGVDYSQDYNDSVRTNMIKNPAVATSIDFYGGTIPANSNHSSAGWNPANVVFSSGAIAGTSQTEASGAIHPEDIYWRIGRDLDASSIPDNLFHINSGTNKWLALRFDVTHDGANIAMQLIAISYNDDGTFYGRGPQNDVSVAQSDTWTEAWDLSDSSDFPKSGWVEFGCRMHDSITKTPFTATFDNFLLEITDGVSETKAGTYFDGDTANAYWLGAANNSGSALGANPLTWGSNPDASFDLDIDSGTEIFDDFEFNFDGFDSLASVIVAATTFEDFDRIYPNNGNPVSDHFDLEVSVHPPESLTQPIIYTNIGSDGSPNWETKTVATRQDGFGVGQVLYDLEDHWLEFQDAPPDLELSWRVTGRIEKRIRIVVTNEELKDESGIELTDTIHIEGNTTPAEAYNLGQAELARRSADATYKFVTYEPGLNPNDEIDITDSLQGLSADTVVINRVTHTYLGGGKTKQFIEAGRYSSGFDDIFMETHNLAEHKTPIGQDTTEVTVALLVDADASILLDADGNQLLDIS